MTLPSTDAEYPDAICQTCERECDITEELYTLPYNHGDLQLWCYCPECDIETFHPINNSAK